MIPLVLFAVAGLLALLALLGVGSRYNLTACAVLLVAVGLLVSRSI